MSTEICFFVDVPVVMFLLPCGYPSVHSDIYIYLFLSCLSADIPTLHLLLPQSSYFSVSVIFVTTFMRESALLMKYWPRLTMLLCIYLSISTSPMPPSESGEELVSVDQHVVHNDFPCFDIKCLYSFLQGPIYNTKSVAHNMYNQFVCFFRKSHPF